MSNSAKCENEQEQKKDLLVDHPKIIYKRSNNRKIDGKIMMTKVKGEVLGIKGSKKTKKLRQKIANYAKLFKDDLIWDYVEGICKIHL